MYPLKKSIITINGDFDYGISDKVEKILKNDQSIKFIILNSDGGLLYEANKLSKLILLNSCLVPQSYGWGLL